MRLVPLARLLAAALAVASTAAAADPAAPAAKPAGPAAPAAPTGLARFTNHPQFVEAKISPKGTWLALVTMEGGRRSLLFQNLIDRKQGYRLGLGTESMVGRYAWANDERVVAELLRQDGILAAPVRYGELLSIDPVRAKAKLIFGYRAGQGQVGSNIRQAEPERAWASVVDTLRDDDRNVLIETARWDDVGDSVTRLVKLDVYTGLKADVTVGPFAEASYLTDEAGSPRIAYALGGDRRLKLSIRDADGTWRPLKDLPGVGPSSEPERFRAADRVLEVHEPVEGGFGLFEVAIDTGARRLLGQTKLAEVSRVLRDGATGRPLAIESEPDLPDWQVLVPEHPLSQLLEGLLDASPGQHVTIVSVTDDQKKAIAWVYGDRSPGRILLVDVPTRTAEVVAESRPWIKPAELAETSAFHIRASDGRLIHGYLTLPGGLAPGAKAPLVVLPHGGPFGVRDRWGFDPDVQLLASEGFAVLQVNYRGSGGYGLAYQEAGYRHWGDRIIDDLLDATRWAVGKGRVDGGRVCAYGASFGGYAAVQATLRAPGLFRCAVGEAGVYDLTKLERNDDIVTSRTVRAIVRTTTGDDAALLQEASPALHADLVTVPLLLIHGAEDKRVPVAHAERLRDALQALGRPPEWLVEPGEGHGFYGEEARLRAATRLVAFLKKHTAPAVPAEGPGPAAQPRP